MSVIFLDLETTGLSEQYCSILEIAALYVEDGVIKAQFHEYINPGKPIPTAVSAINGIYDRDVANCRREKEVLESFVEWCEGLGVKKIIAYNASFDMRFLRGRSDICYVKGHPFHTIEVEDGLKLARDVIKRGKLLTRPLPNGQGKTGGAKQEQVAAALGITYNPHNALEDTLALYKIYFKLKELWWFRRLSWRRKEMY